MKPYFLISLLCFSLMMNDAFAQSQSTALDNTRGTNVVIGQTYTFESHQMAGRWKVQVSLPPGYEQSDDIFPVVYALHGQYYFKFAVGGLQRLMEFGDIPEAIIVGISNESNGYFAFGSDGANLFLDFMEEEIFPFVAQNFRVHQDRTIMGWHYTSGFIFHALVERPHLFKNYIPVSPYLREYDVSKIGFDALDQLHLEVPQVKKALYFGVLNNERSVTTAALSLDSLLRQSSLKNLDWEFNMIEPDYDQGIEISVYRLWQAGLKTVYASYKAGELSYRNLEDFKAQGGLVAMQEHYAQRAAEYGGLSKPSGLFSLVRLAERADDFSMFEQLMTALGSNYESFNLNRIMGFAAFYLKHGKADRAITIYESVNAFYPNSVSVNAAMAQAYLSTDQNEKASAAYQKAIELAKAQSDDRLTALEAKLDELK